MSSVNHSRGRRPVRTAAPQRRTDSPANPRPRARRPHRRCNARPCARSCEASHASARSRRCSSSTRPTANRVHKPATLAHILDMEDPLQTLVFCRMRMEVDAHIEPFNARGHRSEVLRRRNATAPARSRHRVLPLAEGRHADRGRRDRHRPRHHPHLARRQLRRPSGARGVSAPHRPDRPRWSQKG